MCKKQGMVKCQLQWNLTRHELVSWTKILISIPYLAVCDTHLCIKPTWVNDLNLNCNLLNYLSRLIRCTLKQNKWAVYTGNYICLKFPKLNLWKQNTCLFQLGVSLARFHCIVIDDKLFLCIFFLVCIYIHVLLDQNFVFNLLILYIFYHVHC